MTSAVDDSDDRDEKAELLDLLLRATQDGIVDWNLSSGETVYNARFRHLLGFDSEELPEYHARGDSWRELMEPARRAAQRLVDRGEVEITQGGTVVDLQGGDYRERLASGTATPEERETWLEENDVTELPVSEAVPFPRRLPHEPEGE